MSARQSGHFKVVTSGDMSAGINSIGVRLRNLSLSNFQAVFSGSPVGTLKIQVSSQVVQEPAQGGDMSQNVTAWDDYATQDVSAAGSFTFNLANSGYTYARLVYTRSSGTGVLNVSFQGKTQ